MRPGPTGPPPKRWPTSWPPPTPDGGPPPRHDPARVHPPLLAARRTTPAPTHHPGELPADPRLHILPTLGHVALRDLRVDHAETLYTHLLSDGRHDGTGGLSAKSVHEVHVVLRAIGDHAVRHGLLPANPVRLATPPRFRRDHHRRRMAWTADELGHFLTTSRDHVHHRAFWLAAHTGMRRGELMALRWRDIDVPADPSPAPPCAWARP